jgi:hypothetical protein
MLRALLFTPPLDELQPVAPGLYPRDLLSQFRASYLDVDLCCSRDRLSRARAELARASLTAVVLVPEGTQSKPCRCE